RRLGNVSSDKRGGRGVASHGRLANTQTARIVTTPMTAAKRLQRETFRTSRLLDFCSRKELVAQTGHSPQAWPLVLLKEWEDKPRAAGGHGGVARGVPSRVGGTATPVADTAPATPAETVAGVLDFAARVSSREAYVSPTRGAQGNALKTVVTMPFVLD